MTALPPDGAAWPAPGSDAPTAGPTAYDASLRPRTSAGGAAPGEAPRTWRPPAGPPVMSGAAHKPGSVALRPLGLGDIFDASFKLIRHNPQATVGAALLVATVAMALPVVVTALLSASYDLPNPMDPEAVAAESDPLGSIASQLALLTGTVLSSIGQLFVTAMIAHVTLAAALGRSLDLAGAWAATRGRRWHVVGVTLLVLLLVATLLGVYVLLSVLVVLLGVVALDVVWFVLTLPALALGMLWVWIRLCYLPVAVLMLERTGVLGAMRRGFQLTRGQFWRILGTALLTVLVTWFANQLLSTPFGIVALVVGFAMGDSQWALLAVVALQSIGTVLAAAFTSPFTAAVASTQYLDQRFRKEGFDLELMRRIGLTGLVGGGR